MAEVQPARISAATGMARRDRFILAAFLVLSVVRRSGGHWSETPLVAGVNRDGAIQ
jgi:hypothetical protein